MYSLKWILPLVIVFLSLSPTDAFRSIHDLQRILGCRKGDRVAGIYQLKRYLHHYGYLSSYSPVIDGDEDNIFDEKLESALQTYQRYYNLHVTGTLDPQTLEHMIRPRCGVSDIINGADIHGVKPNYAFFPGTPTWPQNKTHFSYAFNPLAKPPIDLTYVRKALSSAFNSWTNATGFVFEEISNHNAAEISIGFFTGEHGDAYPFDGIGQMTAHAFQPTVGWAHFDKEEKWGNAETKTALDMESVALHEFGHILGMAHTPIEEAVMYAFLDYGIIKRSLHTDDINGIEALYELRG